MIEVTLGRWVGGLGRGGKGGLNEVLWAWYGWVSMDGGGGDVPYLK